MQLTVEYAAQLKRAAGRASESFELNDDATLHDLVGKIVERHGDELRRILLADDETPHPSMLVFIDAQQIRGDEDRQLYDGCVVSFLSPIAGG